MGSGIEMASDGGVLVDRLMRSSDDAVWAAGDSATVRDYLRFGVADLEGLHWFQV